MVFHARQVRLDKPFTTTVALRNPGHLALRLRPRLEVDGDQAVAEAMHAQVLAAGGEQLFDGSALRLSKATARRLWIDPHGGATAVTLRLVLHGTRQATPPAAQRGSGCASTSSRSRRARRARSASCARRPRSG